MFLTLSGNEEDVTTFSVIPCIMVVSVGEPAAAGFTVETSPLDQESRSKWRNRGLDYGSRFTC